MFGRCYANGMFLSLRAFDVCHLQCLLLVSVLLSSSSSLFRVVWSTSLYFILFHCTNQPNEQIENECNGGERMSEKRTSKREMTSWIEASVWWRYKMKSYLILSNRTFWMMILQTDGNFWSIHTNEMSEKICNFSKLDSHFWSDSHMKILEIHELCCEQRNRVSQFTRKA